ncbi:hypothetical protein ACFLQW_01915 [Candidatus Zixiibacteriota bacterium]
MILRGYLVAVSTLLLFIGNGAMAQTMVNPDLSVIGDIRGIMADRPEDVGQEQKTVYELHEVELAAHGDLNQYAHADVFFAWHDDYAEVEEAYVTFERGLPGGLSVRAGRYLANFGRLSLLHPHTYSFIDRPLAPNEYLGDHGFADDGVSLRWLMPVSVVDAEISVDLIRGAAFVGHYHHDHEDEAHIPPDKGFLSHLSIAGATGEFSEIAGGISFAYGHYDPAENLISMLLGADIKYEYRPDHHRSMAFQAEVLLNRRETAGEHNLGENGEGEDHEQEGVERTYENFWGAYAVIDYQFHEKYNVGAKFDYYQPLADEDTEVAQAQAFIGFAPAEKTTMLRLAGYYRKPTDREGTFGVTMQLVFALGSHHEH